MTHRPRPPRAGRRARLDTYCCGKVRYATEETARAALDRINAVSSEEKVPVRAYECHNGWWHLTSTTVDEHRDRIMQPRTDEP